MREEAKSSVDRLLLEEVFVTSACAALRELIALEVFAERGLAHVRLPPEKAWVCASIELARKEAGQLKLWLDEETARRLASRYVGDIAVVTPAIVNDFAGELANVIAGQAKTMLKGTEHHFQMTLPVVGRFEGHADLPAIARIDTELGTLWIELVVLSRG